MNKKFVYQVGNNKKVIVWCTANQISRKGNSSLTQANLEHKAKNIYIKEVMYWPKRVEGRDSSVVITTRYGLDGPGIESRWWVIFFAPVQTSRGAHPASYTVGIGSFPGVKRPGRGVDYPPPSSATVNPLKPELNPICYLLALLRAHHFLHVSRIRVKLLTFRRLMSYIYGAPVLDVSRSHTTTQHSR